MAQPYPLFAIVVVTGHWKPYVGRVVGWERVDDSHTGAVGPVLTLGARTFVPSALDHVAYEESREEAERRAPMFAAAARQSEGETVPEQRTVRLACPKERMISESGVRATDVDIPK